MENRIEKLKTKRVMEQIERKGLSDPKEVLKHAIRTCARAEEILNKGVKQ